MTIGLKRGIVYGPVASRRLGRSLGINLLPPRRKLCPFDCVYCQYGPTAAATPHGVAAELPTVDLVAAAVEAALLRLDEPPEWLTFSGNGEPTLHPDFPDAVEAVLELRDRLCPAARTAVLSCSTEAGRPAVRDALARLDARIMKLAAGTDEMLRWYNRPAADITLAGILDGLSGLPDVVIQTLVAAGEGGNFGLRNLKAWLGNVADLQPRSVQLYSLARPTTSRGLLPVGPAELNAIAACLQGAGVAAEVY